MLLYPSEGFANHAIYNEFRYAYSNLNKMIYLHVLCYIAFDSGVRISWFHFIIFINFHNGPALSIDFILTGMLDTVIICNSAKTEQQTPLPFCFHQRFHWRKSMAMSDQSYSIAFSATLIINK